MNLVSNIRFWLLTEPGYGFLDFLASHSTVQACAPARWNARVTGAIASGDRKLDGVNDNSGRGEISPAKKAA